MIFDPEHLFRNQIDGMLTTVSWVEAVKALLGIDGVSQIWETTPAWYFWFAAAQGVYHLELSETSIRDDAPRIVRGTFTVKCYPYADRGAFNLFSFQERNLVLSRFFDNTHTPRFEDRKRIPETLFNVAVLEYELDQETDRACFTLESLDTMRIRYAKDTVQHYDLIGKSKEHAQGETDRAVPGWQMGFLFLDRFLSMHAFYRKAKPTRLRITRSDGFEYVYIGHGRVECVAVPDVHCLCASVSFGPADGCHDLTGIQAHRPAEHDGEPEGATVLYDQAFTCGHCHAAGNRAVDELPDHTYLNPLWWSLADADYKSHLASACGCA